MKILNKSMEKNQYTKAKEKFNQKLDKLEKETQPAFYTQNLKEIVIYEKLIEMQEQINKIEKILGIK
jgi:uncharacterized protein (DUF2164 family)